MPDPVVVSIVVYESHKVKEFEKTVGCLIGRTNDCQARGGVNGARLRASDGNARRSNSDSDDGYLDDDVRPAFDCCVVRQEGACGYALGSDHSGRGWF